MIKVHKRHIVKAISTTLLVILTIYGLIMLENGYFNDIFKKIGVYPENEKFTALFFKDSEYLAKDLNISSTQKSFTFGVYNNEGKDQSFNFAVDVFTKDKMTPVTNGSLFVKSGETAYQEVKFDFSNYAAGSLVYVTLPLNNKSIDFEIN